MSDQRIRLRIASLVVHGQRLAFYSWTPVIKTIHHFASQSLYQRQQQWQEITSAVERHSEQAAKCASAMKSIASVEEAQRNQVLATKAALVQEGARIRADIAHFRVARNRTAQFWTVALELVQSRLERRQKRLQSLGSIVRRIDQDTFYGELLLWLLLSSAHSEEMSGDLSEEYALHRVEKGDVEAAAWYRSQVFRTLRDRFWETVQQLAAIGTLIDIFVQWFRGNR